jgi:hypothetical protein
MKNISNLINLTFLLNPKLGGKWDPDADKKKVSDPQHWLFTVSCQL